MEEVGREGGGMEGENEGRKEKMEGGNGEEERREGKREGVGGEKGKKRKRKKEWNH
jgi:hypothetical protein